MISLLGGIIFTGLGIWGILLWPHQFLMVLKGIVPISLFFGGIIGMIMGFTSMGRTVHPTLSTQKDHEKK